MTRKILIVSNDGKFFLLHRYGLAKGLQQQGYDVLVACPDGEATEQIIAHGFTFYPIPLNRRSLNPLKELSLILFLNKLYKNVKPDIIHHFGIKPIIFGSIAAKFMTHPVIVNAPTGLGYIFTNSTLKAKILQPLVIGLYRFALQNRRSCLIFQNPDDEELFNKLGFIGKKKHFVVKGSGVDLTHFVAKTEESTQPIVVLPARLLWDKGVQEFVDAAKYLKTQDIQARFVLVGDIDPGNPATVSDKQVQAWVSEGIVEWWGWQKDMVAVFHKSHIVCLPSYREGIPKVLIEAAACAKPIVTTDVPGCREVVVDGINGFLVPMKDSAILAERLQLLINTANLRLEMGIRSRERAQAEFSIEKIVSETVNIYQRFLNKLSDNNQSKSSL